MMDTMARIVRASAEGHDEARLQAEKDRLIAGLWISLQTTPDGMSRRLQQLILTGQKLKALEVDDFIEAVKPAANNPSLRADLAALEFVAARLGSDRMAMRIGRQIFEALRKRRPLSAGRLP